MIRYTKRTGIPALHCALITMTLSILLFSPFAFPKDGNLLTCAELSGKYLVRSVDGNGKFAYIYLPDKNEVVAKYNLLRHAGTLYSMYELYEITHDRKLRSAADRAAEYLVRQTRELAIDGAKAACVVRKGAVKLGGNALAIIAFAEYTQVTGDKKYLPLMKKLGVWIRSVQDETGEFVVHKQDFPNGEVHDFTSEYYPGEAVLAMLRLFAVDEDEKWLDVAAKGADYLIDIRDGGLRDDELTHDHWLLYALNELYRFRRKDIYIKHAMRIAHGIMKKQNTRPVNPDWKGSYYNPPRSTPTATRTEGLCAAYFLARDFGLKEDADGLLEAIELGVEFQMKTQFSRKKAKEFSDPERIVGAFHRSLTDYEIRIDYVQHNISSILALHRILKEQGMQKLEGLTWKPMLVTKVGCIKGCLEYLKSDISDAWLYGASGHAFIINIHEVVCPSGPTAWNSEEFNRLCENIGCSFTTVIGHKSQADFYEKQKAAMDLVRKSIDDGIPCFGWELDVPEYYVICGYDESGYYYVGPQCDEPKGPKPWKELGNTEIGVLEVYSVKLDDPADDIKTVKDALAFALEFAESPDKWIFPKYKAGLQGFDLWIKAFENGTADAFGVAYNSAVWAECRSNAVTFLEEARGRFDPGLVSNFNEAIKSYSAVADSLTELRNMFPFFPNEGEDGAKDPDLHEKAVKCLKKARDSEEQALKCLKELHDAL